MEEKIKINAEDVGSLEEALGPNDPLFRKEKPTIAELEKRIGTTEELDIGSIQSKGCLLTLNELSALRSMTLYWQEVFKRDDKQLQLHILTKELSQVTSILGAKKVLQIIVKYVEK